MTPPPPRQKKSKQQEDDERRQRSKYEDKGYDDDNNGEYDQLPEDSVFKFERAINKNQQVDLHQTSSILFSPLLTL